MKSRDSLIRLKRFHAEEKRRRVAQIELMIAEFGRMAKELDDQVVAEQERSGIRDAGHFAYPTLAKAAVQRRDNLQASVNELKEQLEVAKAECEAAIEDLQKQEAIAERDQANEQHPRRGAADASRGATAAAR
ncbi:MAG: flagellar export protein FliJ [Bauldia sp.]